MLEARRTTGPLATSVVCIVEVAGRIRSRERREVGRLLAFLRTFPVNERIAGRPAEVIRTCPQSRAVIGLGDYMVATIAELEACELATLNVRHYPMFTELRPPPQDRCP
jgi:predicted nucleic acid-binding protein